MRCWLMGMMFSGLVGGCWGGDLLRMKEEQAAGFVKLALAGIDREYPNKPGQLMRGAEDVKSPKELHPVFYGQFDWHSSVHGHWMLVRLVKLFPEAAFAGEVREHLATRMTEEGLAAEAAYFEVKENSSFERMYGWAWALRLAAELRDWDDPDGREWARRFQPLEKKIVGLAKAYLTKLEWPIRCGFHPESSFALAQMLDYARTVDDEALAEQLARKAEAFYGGDRRYPVEYEPSGNDFFSAGLNEADLMRRVLDAEEFQKWLTGFFPGLSEGRMGNLLTPAKVLDVSDGHLVHLAGLNLNRAWTMRGIASVLPDGDARLAVLRKAAAEHETAGLALVSTGDYAGEHWLASFAVYLLGGSGT